MHFQRESKPVFPDDAEATSNSSSASLNRDQDTEDTVPARPFVERRRAQPVATKWHEALESVHRLLIRYEEMNQSLLQERERFRSLFENAVIGMFRMTPDGKPLILNSAMAKIFGYESAEQMLAEVPAIGEGMFVDAGKWTEFVRMLEASEIKRGIELEAFTRDGDRRWVQFDLRANFEGTTLIDYEGTAEDIADRKKENEHIWQLAYFDRVTGLPNRALFEERLAESLNAARWNSGSTTLLLLELNRFKIINDTIGRVCGDRLLQETAERIRTTLGPEVTVARLEGAEFGIILQGAEMVDDIEQIARRLIVATTAGFTFMEHSLHLSCAIGISLFPSDGREGQTLLERADVALDSAKEQGGNRVQFFTEDIDAHHRERLNLENGLRVALERDELYLVYQPQVDTRTGSISGLEALLRWQHPEMGLVPPNRFIGVAESSGLITSIGEWVLRTACLQARKWQDAGVPAVPMAVNVSAIQMQQPGFCDMVRSVLQETGLDPKYLELELTEGLLLTNASVMFSLIQELREMGVKLAIDDFGTGYSSLGYLRQFKVNRLKIDRSFVNEIPLNTDHAAITTAIIHMAKALHLKVLAEGVETEEQLDFLRKQQCFDIQGFYLSKPLAVDQIPQRFEGGFPQCVTTASRDLIH